MVDVRVLEDPWRPHLALLMLLAASAEAGSEHPLATAVLKHAALLLGEAHGGGGGPSQTASGSWVGESPPGTPVVADRLGRGSGSGSARVPLVAAAAAAQPAAAGGVQTRSRAIDAATFKWLAPCSHTEAMPGRGVRAWVVLPASGLQGVPTTLLSTQRPGSAAASLPPSRSGSTSSLNIGSGGGGGGMEVRVAVGNRKLMAEEDVPVPAEVRGACSVFSWPLLP